MSSTARNDRHDRQDNTPNSSARRLAAGLAVALFAALAMIGTIAGPAVAQDATPRLDADAQVAPAPRSDLEMESAAAIVTLDGEAPSAADAATNAAVTTGDPLPSLVAKRDDAGAPTDFVSPGQYRANNIWVLIAAGLVFIMHLGFGCVESGLCRAKNSVNILTKNLWIIASGILLYWLFGFNMHYPGDGGFNLSVGEGGVFALGSGPLNVGNADGLSPAYYGGSYTAYTDFIFQAMFAATAATIVSGAVAERIKLAPFMVFAVVFVGFGYPFVGSWHWGGGWLSTLAGGNGFYDFAGSSVVHAFGGFGALAGVLLLGPRIGKYGPGGRVNAIPGHNIPLVNIGVFLLFLGWFGFNGGSVLSAAESTYGPDGVTGGVDFVFVTTTLAGVAGGAVALLTSWAVTSRPDLTMGLNGMLAGLVGITAGANVISPGFAILVGGIAGVLVVFSVYGFDKLRVDDPVGAISVHGVCGIWGTLAVGLFSTNENHSFVAQLFGTVAVSVTAFLIALTIFGILKLVGGIRVSEAEEIEGLDLGEHGMSAYHDVGRGSAAVARA